jgi:hypothetical protein
MRTRGFAAMAAVTAILALGTAAPAVASTARRVYVNCYPSSTSVAFPAFQALQHPERCNIQGEPEDEAHLLQLTQAHWSGWGTASSLTQGQALSNNPGMGGPPSFPVHVRLFRIRVGCHGRRFYTRAQVASSFGTGTLRLTPTCKAIPLSA